MNKSSSFLTVALGLASIVFFIISFSSSFLLAQTAVPETGAKNETSGQLSPDKAPDGSPLASPEASPAPATSAATKDKGPTAPKAEGEKQKGPAPILLVENPEWLAGDNKPGSTISHDFTIKNPGEADLFISAVIPGCGCTVAKFSSLVPPGGEGKVTLSIDLYEEWAGRDVNKSATILSNDPVNPQQRVVVRAKVMPKS